MQTKYNLGQKLYYLNKGIKKDIVTAINIEMCDIVYNIFSDVPFVFSNSVSYTMNNGDIIDEAYLFETRESLKKVVDKILEDYDEAKEALSRQGKK